jgi:short-subunit dehydrogenase involved in D-alanine esterification of teichoic acids
MPDASVTSLFDLHGWRIAVAGGSKGIRRSIALAFAEAGAAVSICAITGQTLCVDGGQNLSG